jgi:tetratricopeptide (TPR) repeat protein
MLKLTRLSLLPTWMFIFSLGLLAWSSLTYQTQGGQARPSSKEEAYRANNIGVALLEQYKHKEAADQFRRALQVDPGLTIARVNLCIALFNEPNINAALVEARAAAAASPNLPHPHYILGLIARTQNRIEDALASFQRVLQIDQRDLGASVNIGQILNLQRKYAEAIPILRAAFEAEPYSATAAYTLGIALNRAGQREEAQKVNAQFNALRQGVYVKTPVQKSPNRVNMPRLSFPPVRKPTWSTPRHPISASMT